MMMMMMMMNMAMMCEYIKCFKITFENLMSSQQPSLKVETALWCIKMEQGAEK
jgi:hypothetical protein